MKNLVIVESPAKAKTIERFLGKDFNVMSSFGHVRDLSKKDFGININKDYSPVYEISPEKKKVVSDLKKQMNKSEMVWLASDEDREGEAIAWHLAEVMDLKPEKTKRIVFHEITKSAIIKAIENPRGIDFNLVNAQQARRVLDRLVGFELSPVLWKKVKPSLSAGRVQSVAVRLIVEKEREILKFKPNTFFRTTGQFSSFGVNGNEFEFKAELNTRFEKTEEVENFLDKCKNAKFNISSIQKKPSKKSPSPPFTTSTLQQEASRKLGFPVSLTMNTAQRLYEAGHITYMRTDSVNLSNQAIGGIKAEIEKKFGEQYLKIRKYKTKAKGAQEAHEAIRPTYFEKETIEGSNAEVRLYDLIRKRTIASQMSDAKLEKTNAIIAISTSEHDFIASGEVLIFDGFLKLYQESTDDENQNGDAKSILPPLVEGKDAVRNSIHSVQRFSTQPARYTEASLVKKLEELGIGRPSTYAPTISTIQNRDYVIKEDREGKERKFETISLINQDISKVMSQEIFGFAKAKLFPTDIGIVVTDFLMTYFTDIMNYNFTADVEKQFDEIAAGNIVWNSMIDKFYKPFHIKVEDTLKTSDFNKGEKELGIDPVSNKKVYARIGRYGPMAQIGHADDEEKPRFAALRKGQHIETITLDEALELFKLPRTLGKYEEKVVVVGIGRFGPYIRFNNGFVSLKKDIDDPHKIELERAIELIEEKRKKDREKIIKVFDEDPEIQILNGRWGPYIAYQKKNYRIPKTADAAKFTIDDCKSLIESGNKGSKSNSRKTSIKRTKKK